MGKVALLIVQSSSSTSPDFDISLHNQSAASDNNVVYISLSWAMSYLSRCLERLQ